VNRDAELPERARAWRTAMLESVCDVIEPWAHGAIYRAPRYPSYYDYNLVRVQDRAPVRAQEMLAIADEALAGLAHRTIEFDFVDNAAPLRRELEPRGWRATRLLWLLHAGDPPRADPHFRQATTLEEVPYDTVNHLRAEWHAEDFPGDDPTAFHATAREVALHHGARVFAVCRNATPVAFAQIIHLGSRMEIEQVYVGAAHRGQGLGTAVTSAAICTAAGAGELWICADDEGRAKHLYARLGFRPARTTMELLRMPRPGSAT
jgi:GNAT superfamily N-acetyltransferase